MMERKTKKTQCKSSLDSATQYAQNVVSGKLIAGPDIRNACKRHLDDLEQGHKRGLFFDSEQAEKYIRFFCKVLKLNGGDYEGKPFIPLPWQCFIISSLFGWKTTDGARRFNQAYIETGKGSGKSPLAAGIGLAGMIVDDEPRAEIYAAATKKDQAMILFRDAVAMVEQSPELAKRISTSGGKGKEWNLAYLKKNSFFRPISSDDGQSGPRPHIGLIDELHEHKTNIVFEMLKAGTKSRKNPLILAITNSGADKHSPCWEYHEYGVKVASGEIIDDSFFSYICSLDEGDDPLEDESCWCKSNPSLQESDLPGMKYLRGQIIGARGMPSKESIVRRLNFCEWVGALNPWISIDVWKEQKLDFDWRTLRGRRAWGGLDLSSTTDLTGLVFVVEPIEEGEPWLIVPFAWVPDENIADKEKKDGVPYSQWKTLGFLETTPGAAVSKLMVAQKLSALCDFFDVQCVAYDRWRIVDFVQSANDSGVTLPEMVAFGQGFKDMTPAIEKFETMLLNHEIVHPGHPVLNWCAGNAVAVSDDAGNRKLSKEKATGRMDLIIATVMAVGVIEKQKTQPDYAKSIFIV
ncbi:terminase [Snodgrassella alvi]|nr:terminase [Snodgrassella alvi]